jgi:putative FmdB family regulatory protein
MPTYEYKCTKCSHCFEVFQKITDTPVKICPVCKGKVKRLISGGSGLIFKGTGFYITDYKKKVEKTEPKETSAKPTPETKKKTNKD